MKKREVYKLSNGVILARDNGDAEFCLISEVGLKIDLKEIQHEIARRLVGLQAELDFLYRAFCKFQGEEEQERIAAKLQQEKLERENLKRILNKPITAMELSPRVSNLLRNVKYIGELVQRS